MKINLSPTSKSLRIEAELDASDYIEPVQELLQETIDNYLPKELKGKLLVVVKLKENEG